MSEHIILSGADSYNTTARFGKGSGPTTGPSNGCTNVVISIEGYYDSSYIYGIKLGWSGSKTQMHGFTNSRTGVFQDLSGDPVREIKYYVDDGKLRGLRFRTCSNRAFIFGKSPSSWATAFTNPGASFTDMKSYTGTQNKKDTIWGVVFNYTGSTQKDPSIMPDGHHRHCPREMSWPALAVLAHGTVVAKSLMKVGKLRGQLGIKAPSCDPPLTTSPADSQLWYRTFRAQENCKETFLIYLPSILIASTLGYHAFGKWVPRTVGALAFTSAIFRYKYLNAYIEDADKRGKPFYYAHMCMRPVFVLAVVSAGYLLGKELYYCAMSCTKSSKEETDE